MFVAVIMLEAVTTFVAVIMSDWKAARAAVPPTLKGLTRHVLVEPDLREEGSQAVPPPRYRHVEFKSYLNTLEDNFDMLPFWHFPRFCTACFKQKSAIEKIVFQIFSKVIFPKSVPKDLERLSKFKHFSSQKHHRDRHSREFWVQVRYRSET